MLDSSPTGLLLLDNQGRVSWINQTLQTLLGTTAEQLLNKSIRDTPAELQGLFANDTITPLPANNGNGEAWLKITSQALPDHTGTIQYFEDITELHQLMDQRDSLQAELDDVVMVDPETGMRNRKGLYYSLEPQLSRSRRYDRPLSIIIMRLNCMDDFIQQTGLDNATPLLMAISYLLNDQLRWADIVGRLSETDFLLVLPETKIDAVQQVVDNLKTQLKQTQIPEHENSGFEISALFGIAEWRRGDDMGLLLMRARETFNGDTDPQPATAG